MLINTLNNSKLTSSVIQERVLEAEQTEIEINEAREQYRVVPNRASVLYFVIADLGLVDPMYQFSLSYFSVLVTAPVATPSVHAHGNPFRIPRLGTRRLPAFMVVWFRSRCRSWQCRIPSLVRHMIPCKFKRVLAQSMNDVRAFPLNACRNDQAHTIPRPDQAPQHVITAHEA